MSSYDGYIDFESQLSLANEQKNAGFRRTQTETVPRSANAPRKSFAALKKEGAATPTGKRVSIRDKMALKRKLKQQQSGDDGEECVIF